MLQALGLQAKPTEAELAAQRLVGLKDPRAWPEAVSHLLRTVAPGETLGKCKDRRVLESLLSLCEAQLSPYPSGSLDTIMLLRAVARVLGTRALHAFLPKVSLGFLARAGAELVRAASGGSGGEEEETLLPAGVASATLTELIGVYEAIVELPGAAATAEEERQERQARSALEASGGVAEVVGAAAIAAAVGTGDRV